MVQPRLQHAIALGVRTLRIEVDHVDIVERRGVHVAVAPIPHQIAYEAGAQAPVIQAEPAHGAQGGHASVILLQPVDNLPLRIHHPSFFAATVTRSGGG